MRIFQELAIDQMLIKDRDIVFDLDGTLIEGDIGETLYFHTVLAEFINKCPDRDWLKPFHPDPGSRTVSFSNAGVEIISDYRDELASGNYEKAYGNTAKRLESCQREDIETLVNAFLSEETNLSGLTCQRSMNGRIERFFIPYGVRIRSEMMRLVEFFNKQGANLWIVSASPQMVCELVARKFEINIDNVMGTSVSADGKTIRRFPWGPKKLEILLEAGVTHPLFVFGDGEGDLEMLEIAEYPVAVKGNSRKIIELAIKSNWWIFSNNEGITEK